jgi:hypothetical protein
LQPWCCLTLQDLWTTGCTAEHFVALRPCEQALSAIVCTTSVM